MDIYRKLVGEGNPDAIHTVDLHTAGEPTRIVVSGYPPLQGRTLLEKRAYAREHVDHLRTRLMWEPRGHADMYGALLVHETELTENGDADIGVLFMHNEGYSTMCGHATIALGRFLVDTQDEAIFPRRKNLPYNPVRGETEVRLHAPCGIVRVMVPTTVQDGRLQSDTSRPVTFTSVPSFVSALDIDVDIPEDQRWTALRVSGRTRVRLDMAYGGAFYAIVGANELGFGSIVGGEQELREMDEATATLKSLLAGRRELIAHPSEEDMEYLYGVIVTEDREGDSIGLCFFANREVDRSPTGSGVSARVALAVATGRMRVGETAVFHSPVSVREGDGGGFTGTAGAATTVAGKGREWAAVRVAVGGRGWYTGAHAFVAERGDAVGVSGFLVRDCL